MKTGWLVGLGVLFVLLHIFNGICEMSYVTGDTQTIFGGVMQNVQVISGDYSFLTKAWEAITLPWEVVVLVLKMLWFDYAWLQEGFYVLRIIFWAVSAGVIISLVLAMRGTSSS